MGHLWVQIQGRHRGVKPIQIVGKLKQTILSDGHYIIGDIGMDKPPIIDRHYSVGYGNDLPFHPCRTGGKSCIQSWSSPIAARPVFAQFQGAVIVYKELGPSRKPVGCKSLYLWLLGFALWGGGEMLLRWFHLDHDLEFEYTMPK